jgi:hypothetical protein
MQTVTKKSVVESLPSKPAMDREPDIAFVPVSNALAEFHVNLGIGLTHAEVDTRHAIIRAVAGFAMAVTTVIGRFLGLVVVGLR